MKADISRDTFQATKHYRDVIKQQGRVDLDADANEQQAINMHRMETGMRDIVGHAGAPAEHAGFAISIDGTAPNQSIEIGTGRMYVDGVLVENDASAPVKFSEQPDYRPDSPLSPIQAGAGGKTHIIYLDVWARLLTALDDSEIREVALGGPDTAARSKVVWQAKYAELDNDSRADGVEQFQGWKNLIAEPTGTMAADTSVSDTSVDLCTMQSGAGYTRLENQLYRVEIHDGNSAASGATPTFKWSRDNGAVVTTVSSINGADITVDDIGPDNILGFSKDQWVELIDDTLEWNGQTRPLLKILKVDRDTRIITIDNTVQALGSGTSGVDPDKHPKLRRWDGFDTVAVDGSDKTLESGITVNFSNGTYRSGDYWLIPARTAAGIEWPKDNTVSRHLPPHGVRHHYCLLATIAYSAGNFVVDDLRKIFPPEGCCRDTGPCHNFLAELRADGVIRRLIRGREVLGFAVGIDASKALTISCSGGIAYVNGCRHVIHAKSIPVEESVTAQLLIIDSAGTLRMVRKMVRMGRYAGIARITTYDGEITRIDDIRRDVTRLDDRVDDNFHRTAGCNIDRRQFVPLLAYSIKGLEHRNGRNLLFSIDTIISQKKINTIQLTFDGENVWAFGPGGALRIPRDAISDDQIQKIAYPSSMSVNSISRAAFDGKNIWIAALSVRNSVLCRMDMGTDPLQFIQLSVESAPNAIAFDGDFIWVCHSFGIDRFDVETLQKDKSRFVEIGGGRALAFDGMDMWVAAHSNIYKVPKAGDYKKMVSFESGTPVFDVSASGTTGDEGSSTVSMVVGTASAEPATRGAVPETLVTGAPSTFEPVFNPPVVTDLAFDGAYLWYALDNKQLKKIDVGNMENIDVRTLENVVSTMVFDGVHLWGFPQNGNLKTNIENTITGNNFTQHLPKLPSPESVAIYSSVFDGTHLWVACSAGIVKKIV